MKKLAILGLVIALICALAIPMTAAADDPPKGVFLIMVGGNVGANYLPMGVTLGHGLMVGDTFPTDIEFPLIVQSTWGLTSPAFLFGPFAIAGGPALLIRYQPV